MKWIYIFLSGVLLGVLMFFLGAGAPVPTVMSAMRASTAVAPPIAIPGPAQVDMAEPSSIQRVASTRFAPAVVIVKPVTNQLLIPVAGVSASQLSDTFNQARGIDRRHEALDIPAPKGTHVFAVADGKVAKLFDSKPGGLTIYQFDISEKFVYYYAHLDRYAEGIEEGILLKRGDLIGYVGATGNAATPHLHFTIFELGPEKQWWKGSAINPFTLLGGVQPP
ncbi:MAG: M23 family metallopeptidase [Proteobacteria bacterium]|nr:M23 family metallopeptidase [Pseudomonadota bacterium]